MTVLLPGEDGIAGHVAARLPTAEVAVYGAEVDPTTVTFCCLPYMDAAGALQRTHRMPRLAVVQTLSSGVDDVLPHAPGWVSVCNGRGLHHEEGTAELAVALLLASVRELPRFVAQQRRGEWGHVRTGTLDGLRVLIVGHGAIGLAVEARLRPFGAHVAWVSRTARPGVAPFTELARLAADADALVVCVPLTEETSGLVDAATLAALPDQAIVVNVARGPVVDAAALRAELVSGRLRAALDVTDPEPPPADAPEFTLPNVLLTPHVGGNTAEFARRAPGFVAEQVRRHLAGEPLRNVVRGPLTAPPAG